MIQVLAIAATVSFVAYVYSQVLTMPDMILNKVHNHVDRYFPKWLSYPLIVCFKCVSGQLAFWYYIIRYHDVYSIEFRNIGGYSLPVLVKQLDRYSWEVHICSSVSRFFFHFFTTRFLNG
jgi:hypothetical protein